MTPAFGTLTGLLVVPLAYLYWRAMNSVGSSSNAEIGGELGDANHYPPRSAHGPDGTAVDARPPEDGDAVVKALAAIRKVDRTFRGSRFLEGAAASYEAIVDAFADGNASVLVKLTSASVYEQFLAAIVERGRQNQRVELIPLKIVAATIVDAQIDGRSASISVRFSSICIERRRRDGVVEESSGETTSTVDEWTFARELRSRAPDWILVSTRPPTAS